MKALFATLAILLAGSSASANIFIQCGRGLDDQEGTLEETVLTLSSESWIEGTSGEDFDLEVDGKDIIGAKGSGSSAEGLTVEKGDGFGGSGLLIEVDPWEDLTTKARKKSPGQPVQELDCLVTEM